MQIKNRLQILVFLLSLSLTGCVSLVDRLANEGYQKLTGSEIESLLDRHNYFSGVSERLGPSEYAICKNRVFAQKLPPPPDTKTTYWGHWWISDDKFCVKWSNQSEGCLIFFQKDTEIKQLSETRKLLGVMRPITHTADPNCEGY